MDYSGTLCAIFLFFVGVENMARVYVRLYSVIVVAGGRVVLQSNRSS